MYSNRCTYDLTRKICFDEIDATRRPLYLANHDLKNSVPSVSPW